MDEFRGFRRRDIGDMAYTPYYPGYQPMYYQPPMPDQLTQLRQQQFQPMPQQQAPQQNVQSNFFCRPVASKEEALGVPVDFMGNPMFFPDLAHNTVYMKRFNTNSGSADIFEFKLDGVKESETLPAFAPLNEFIDMKNTIKELQDEINRLKKPAGKAVKKDVQSDE